MSRARDPRRSMMMRLGGYAKRTNETTLIFGGDSGNSIKDLSTENIRSILNLPEILEQEVLYGDRAEGIEWRLAPTAKALVNADDHSLYGIVTDRYRTVRHEEGIRDLTEVVESNPEFGRIEWSVSHHKNFAKMRAEGRFLDCQYEIQPGDFVNPTVEYYNSYDGTWGERFIFGAYRVICSNGLVRGKQLFSLAHPHVGLERPDQILLEFNEALETFSMETELWKSWVDRRPTIANVEDTIENMELTGKETDEVIEMVDEHPEMNLWEWFNVMTALITHRMASLNKQVKAWNRLRKVQSDW